MQVRATRRRRIALALAIPVFAVGVIALTAGAAVSSASVAALAEPTDDPGQQQPGDPGQQQPGDPGQQQPGDPGQQQIQPGSEGPQYKPPVTKPPYTKPPVTKPPVTKPPYTKPPVTKTPVTKTPGNTTTVTKTATATATKTATATASPSVSGSPSGSAAPPRQPGQQPGGVGGVPGVNCAKNSAPTPVTVQIGPAGGKEALVDADGCALYVFTKDNPQTSGCEGQCETTWPPLKGPGQAGSGVDQANLGTFNRQSGTEQVTFYGKQLYYYSGDSSPGQGNGQGVDQTWYLVNKDGNPITS